MTLRVSEYCSHRAFIFLSNTIQWLGGYRTNISHFLYICSLVIPHSWWKYNGLTWSTKNWLSMRVASCYVTKCQSDLVSKSAGSFLGQLLLFSFSRGGTDLHSPRALVRITLGSWHYVWHGPHYTRPTYFIILVSSHSLLSSMHILVSTRQRVKWEMVHIYYCNKLISGTDWQMFGYFTSHL